MRGLIAGVLLILAGNAMAFISMTNRYMEFSAEPVPQELAGTWTGAHGPYLITLIINQDGTGVSCASWHKHNSLSSVKHNAGMLYYSDGGEMIVQSFGDGLTLASPKGGAVYKYIRDDAFKEAAPYCKKELT